MPRLHALRRRSILAAWIAWPVGLLLAAALAFYVWLRSLGTVFVDFHLGWEPPASAADALATALPLLLLLAVLVGPPLALTVAWRRSRARTDRDRPT